MRYRYLILVLAILLCTRVSAQNEIPSLDNLEVISAENVNRLEELAVIGRGTISNAIWSPDGATIAVAGSRGIWLYDANDLETSPRLLTGHTGPVSTLAFSPNSQLLASGSTDRVQIDSDILIWNVVSGELLQTLQGHTDSIGALAFSPDGDYLVSGAWQRDKTVRVWQRTSQGFEMVASTEIPYYFGAVDITFHSNGDEVAFAFSDNRKSDGSGIYITHWQDLLEGDADFIFLDGSSQISTSVSFHPDTRHLAYSAFVQMGVYDLQNHVNSYQGQPVYALPVYDVSYSPDGSTLAISLYNREIHLWDAQTNEPQRVIQWGNFGDFNESSRPSPSFYRLEFSPDSTRLLSALPDNTVRIWDVSSGELLVTLDGFTPAVETFAFTSTDEIIAAGTDRDGNLWRWDNAGETTLIPVDETFGVFEMELSPEGAYLVYVTNEPISNHSLIIYDTQTAASFVLPTEQGRSINIVGYSRDGEVVAIYNESQEFLEFWDMSSHALISHFSTFRIIPLYSPEFLFFDTTLSPILLTNIWDNVFYQLDIQTGDLQTLFETEQGITSTALNPDASLIALAISDRYEDFVEVAQVEVFDTITQEHVYTLVGHSDWISTMMFNASGDLLITGSWDRSLRFWDVATGEQITSRMSHTDDVTQLAFNGEGTLLASGSADGTVHIWGVPFTNDD